MQCFCQVPHHHHLHFLSLSPSQGHTEEVCALATHPTQNQFLTAGYDKAVHLWDSMAHLVVWSKDIGESAQAASFSPDGSIIIISTTTVGRWIVFDATTRQLISIHSDGADVIECIKFSPDGRYLAFGSRDNNIYIYLVSEEYRKFNRIGRCSGHSAYITHIGKSIEGPLFPQISLTATCSPLHFLQTGTSATRTYSRLRRAMSISSGTPQFAGS